jgi:hypothetical protein
MTDTLSVPAEGVQVLEQDLAPLAVADRCDRCGAQAFVRARLASGYELLFCGHHGRDAMAGLMEVGAAVRDDTSRIGATATQR